MHHHERLVYITIEGRTRRIFQRAKCRAKRDEITFTITEEEVLRLLLVGKCAQSGILFDLQGKKNTFRNPFAPSIDRIDSMLGYEKGNVQLVCNMFNSGKGEHDEIDFIAMCIAVAQLNQDNAKALERLNELRNAAV